MHSRVCPTAGISWISLDRALRDVRTKRRQRIGVIIVDISRFKLVNDMLGHTAGDELMVQAARRFENQHRRSRECWPAGAVTSLPC